MRNQRLLALATAGSASLPLGFIAATWPVYALLMATTLPCLVLLRRTGTGRLAFLTIASMLAFQSDNDALKNLTIAVAFILTPMSLRSLIAGSSPRLHRSVIMGLILSSMLWLALLSCNLLVSFMNGTPALGPWLKAASPYILIAILPLIGLANGLKATPAHLDRLIFALSVVAPIAFMTDWLSRRGVSQLPIGRIGLASLPLCIFAFAFFLSRGVAARHKSGWTLLAILVFLAVMLTGTRTGLILLPAFLAAMGPRRLGFYTIRHLASVLIGATLALVGALPILAANLSTSASFQTDRIKRIVDDLSRGTVTVDASAALRLHQTDVFNQAFRANPISGQGLGVPRDGLDIDTPVAYLAYFGLAGVAVLVIVSGGWLLGLTFLLRTHPWPAYQTLIQVVAVGLLLYTPLSSPLDDKGVGILLMLLAAQLGRHLASIERSEGAAFVTHRPPQKPAMNLRSTMRGHRRTKDETPRTILRRHGPVGLALCAAVVLIAVAYTWMQSPVYTSQGTGIVRVYPSPANAGEAVAADSFAKSRALSYAELADSISVAEVCAHNRGGSESPEALLSRITVQRPPDTVILQIAAKADSARAAQKLADDWLDALSQKVDETESGQPRGGTSVGARATFAKVGAAQLPLTPSSPNRLINLLSSLLLGGLLGAGYIYVRSQTIFNFSGNSSDSEEQK